MCPECTEKIIAETKAHNEAIQRRKDAGLPMWDSEGVYGFLGNPNTIESCEHQWSFGELKGPVGCYGPPICNGINNCHAPVDAEPCHLKKPWDGK